MYSSGGSLEFGKCSSSLIEEEDEEVGVRTFPLSKVGSLIAKGSKGVGNKRVL